MNELVQILKNTRQHLMTGVSHMIPFVVSGGILLAVSVMLYGKGAVPDAATDPNLKKLFDIGVAGLTLMVPFLAAYIGYSIADRAALAPCAIGAWVGNSFGAGFFGALIAGMIRDQLGSFEWAWWSLMAVSGLMLLIVMRFNPAHYARHIR